MCVSKKKNRPYLFFFCLFIYWCLVSCFFVLLLLFCVPCLWEVGAGGWGKNLSNFFTDMDYLYCMPKWSHSCFYEIKLLRNISIYWYIKFIKTVHPYIVALSAFYEFCLKFFHLCCIRNQRWAPTCASGGFSKFNGSDWQQSFLLTGSFDDDDAGLGARGLGLGARCHSEAQRPQDGSQGGYVGGQNDCVQGSDALPCKTISPKSSTSCLCLELFFFFCQDQWKYMKTIWWKYLGWHSRLFLPL